MFLFQILHLFSTSSVVAVRTENAWRNHSSLLLLTDTWSYSLKRCFFRLLDCLKIRVDCYGVDYGLTVVACGVDGLLNMVPPTILPFN